jgi:hypothetical protein
VEKKKKKRKGLHMSSLSWNRFPRNQSPAAQEKRGRERGKPKGRERQRGKCHGWGRTQKKVVCFKAVAFLSSCSR